MSDDEAKTLHWIITIAQTLLLKEREIAPITPALIAEKVEVASNLVAPEGGVDTAAVVRELIRRFSHWIGKNSTLLDDGGTCRGWSRRARGNDGST